MQARPAVSGCGLWVWLFCTLLLSFPCLARDDYYRVLGISRTADAAGIKSAFRALAKQHHPDKGGDKATFQTIQEAYGVLSDEKRKAEYDDSFSAPRGYQHGGGGFGGHHRGFRQPREQRIDSRAELLTSQSFGRFKKENDFFFLWVYNAYDYNAPSFAQVYDRAIPDFEGIAGAARFDTKYEHPYAMNQLRILTNSEFVLYANGEKHVYSGPHRESLPGSSDDIVDFFFRSVDCHIEWVTDSSLESFKASHTHLNKVLYLLSDRELNRVNSDGIPLDLIRLYMRFTPLLHFGVATLRNPGIIQEFGVPSYGRTLVVLKDGGSSYVRKKGGLRPHHAIEGFLADNIASAVHKLTPGFRDLCRDPSGNAVLGSREDTPGSTCALLFLPPGVSEADAESFRSAFRDVGISSTKVWVNSAAQPKLASLFGLGTLPPGEAVVVVLSKKASHLRQPYVTAASPMALRLSEDRLRKVEQDMQAMRIGHNARPFDFPILPDGETAPGVGMFGLRWGSVSRTLSYYWGYVPVEFLFAVLVIVFLWGMDDPARRGASQNNNSVPRGFAPSGRGSTMPRRAGTAGSAYPSPGGGSVGGGGGGPSVAPSHTPQRASPAQGQIAPLGQSHLDTRRHFVVVFFVPSAASLRSIQIPASIANDPKVMLAHVVEGPGASQWYNLLGFPPARVSIAVLRGGQRKWAALHNGSTSVSGDCPPAGELQVKIDQALSGCVMNVVDSWPPLP
eukprot:TRINITY_DN51326_c0_g1_i1.p1 TRINITY_DN51326_c0_g1~~TRINITY_DN51326_c0_g1_i1.p1  ORF type:complete len:744 (+),score=209.07 TRINITY_DN51326_c0_g1_i1:39-2234(+)